MAKWKYQINSKCVSRSELNKISSFRSLTELEKHEKLLSQFGTGRDCMETLDPCEVENQ